MDKYRHAVDTTGIRRIDLTQVPELHERIPEHRQPRHASKESSPYSKLGEHTKRYQELAKQPADDNRRINEVRPRNRGTGNYSNARYSGKGCIFRARDSRVYPSDYRRMSPFGARVI